MLRKFTILTASPAVFATAVIHQQSSRRNEVEKTQPPISKDLQHYLRKPSDLPAYAPLHNINSKKTVEHTDESSILRGGIESCICVVRTEIQAGWHAIMKNKLIIENYIDTVKLKVHSSIDYLNQPHNLLPRTGAIAIGGLSGFLFAARGGIIKKFFYTTLGAGSIASLCYPRQAEQLLQDALYQTRKGYAITYNFIMGTKPGEGISIEPINKFPTSVEDIKFLIYDLYEETKNAVFSEKK